MTRFFPKFVIAAVEAPAFNNPIVLIKNAGNAIVIDKTTKAEVLAALGAATIINFDSGFEVWVYRAKSRAPAEAKAEFAILFDPSGIVKKTRLRPGYPARG